MAPLPGQAARAARTIFPEDVVLRTSGNATITGIIGRVGGQSDEEASEASDDDGTPLVDGAATVRWLNSGISEVEQVGALRVVDRAFVHGDIVAPAVGPQAQSGTVVGISLALDVRLPSGTVREFVPSELIDHIKPFRPGTYAVYGTWLGRVDECMDNITLAFGDGGQVKLLRVHPDDVVAVHRSFDDHCPFFPGQLVKTRAGVLRRGKWVSGKYSREYADQIAVVSSVQPCRVRKPPNAAALRSRASFPPRPSALRASAGCLPLRQPPVPLIPPSALASPSPRAPRAGRDALAGDEAGR